MYKEIPWRFYLIQWYENDTAIKNAGGIDYILIRTSVSDEIKLEASIRMYRVEGLKQGSNWIRLTVIGKNGQVYVSQITLIVDDPVYRQRIILITIGVCAVGSFGVGIILFSIKKRKLRRVNDEWNKMFVKESQTEKIYENNFNFDKDILEEENTSEKEDPLNKTTEKIASVTKNDDSDEQQQEKNDNEKTL